MQLMATLLFLAYGLPLIRSNRPVGIAALALLGAGVFTYMLPFAFFLVERCRPSSDLWMALVQTNPAEVREYLSTTRWLPGLVPPLLLLILLLAISRKLRPGRPRWRTALLFSGLFITEGTSGAFRDLTTAWKVQHGELAVWKGMLESRERLLRDKDFTAVHSGSPRKIMVILGESTTRRHMSLYGYESHTTPGLDAASRRGGFYVFDDTISPHTLTMPSLEKVLTLSNNECPLPFVESPSILDVFHRAGFQTTWISNQNRAGIFDNQVSVIAARADQVRFSSARVGADYEGGPDEVLFPLLDEALPHCQPNTLLVVHLLGAHSDYGRRVPMGYGNRISDSQEHFTGYDLALRYGDEILTHLMMQGQAAGFDTVVYLPDHGESPHDGRRHNPGRYTPEMVEIPFLIWLSPDFRKAHPEWEQRLEAARRRPWMSDDFFHALIDLAGIQSNLLDPTRSVLNDAFQARPRRVIQGQLTYEPSPDPHSLGRP